MNSAEKKHPAAFHSHRLNLVLVTETGKFKYRYKAIMTLTFRWNCLKEWNM